MRTKEALIDFEAINDYWEHKDEAFTCDNCHIVWGTRAKSDFIPPLNIQHSWCKDCVRALEPKAEK